MSGSVNSFSKKRVKLEKKGRAWNFRKYIEEKKSRGRSPKKKKREEGKKRIFTWRRGQERLLQNKNNSKRN